MVVYNLLFCENSQLFNLQGVHCDMKLSKYIFWAEKKISQA